MICGPAMPCTMLSETIALTRPRILIVNPIVVDNLHVMSNPIVTFIHFNARSLNKNFQKIKEYLDDLELSFDITAISETWAEPNTTEDILLNGYEVFHIARANRKGGDVALFNFITHSVQQNLLKLRISLNVSLSN